MEGIVVPIAERKKRNKMLRILLRKENGILPNAIREKLLPVLWGTRRKRRKNVWFSRKLCSVQKPLTRVLSTK